MLGPLIKGLASTRLLVAVCQASRISWHRSCGARRHFSIAYAFLWVRALILHRNSYPVSPLRDRGFKIATPLRITLVRRAASGNIQSADGIVVSQAICASLAENPNAESMRLPHIQMKTRHQPPSSCIRLMYGLPRTYACRVITHAPIRCWKFQGAFSLADSQRC